MKKITSAISTAVTTFAKADKAHNKVTTEQLDLLYADGVREADLLAAPKGEPNSELYTGVQVAILAAFNAAEKKLLATDTRLLDETGKTAKRKLAKDAARTMGNLRRGLKSRDPKAPKAPSGETKQTAAASVESNPTSATPLKAYIEHVSTGHSVVNAIPPSKITTAKVDKIKKMIGDLLEELNSIK